MKCNQCVCTHVVFAEGTPAGCEHATKWLHTQLTGTRTQSDAAVCYTVRNL